MRCVILAVVLAVFCSGLCAAPAVYIDTSFENASPLWWDVADDGAIHVYLVYDHERGTVNRANGHWHFRVEAPAGSEVTLVLYNFDNVWNGRKGSPVSARTNCYVSADGRSWTIVPAGKTPDNCVKVRIEMQGDSLFVARMEPYTLRDLDRFLAEVKNHSLVELTQIGRTVEGRPLEIVRVGRPDAKYRVLIRGRAHPWEAGGNWVIDGLIRSLLEDDEDSRRFLGSCCLYVMPMANKDGVARGPAAGPGEPRPGGLAGQDGRRRQNAPPGFRSAQRQQRVHPRKPPGRRRGTIPCRHATLRAAPAQAHVVYRRIDRRDL